MPIYTYQCGDCGTTEDYLVNTLSAKPEEGCRACHGTDLTRVFDGQTFSTKTTTQPTQEPKTLTPSMKLQLQNDVAELREETMSHLHPGLNITTKSLGEDFFARDVTLADEQGRPICSSTTARRKID